MGCNRDHRNNLNRPTTWVFMVKFIMAIAPKRTLSSRCLVLNITFPDILTVWSDHGIVLVRIEARNLGILGQFPKSFDHFSMLLRISVLQVLKWLLSRFGESERVAHLVFVGLWVTRKIDRNVFATSHLCQIHLDHRFSCRILV